MTELDLGETGLAEGKDFLVLLGGKELLPGLTAGLVGAGLGESREIEISFPEDHQSAAIAGKTALYKIEVKGIRGKIVPDFDEEILKELEVDSESALREKVRAQLVDAAQREERERLRNEIGKFLLDKTDFDLPQSIVDQETNLAAQHMVRRIAGQGATRAQIAEQQQSILTAAEQSSKDRVKLSYILSRIADEEGISVADDEINERIETMASHYGMPPEHMRAELEKRNAIEHMKSDLRGEKTVDLLLEHAKIKK
jgi:trigger factor